MNEDMWLESKAKIVYDPYRGGMKHRVDWWCVAEVDREITRYYRWWLQKEFHLHDMLQPSWDAHISIIRGEKPTPKLMHLWKKYNGMVVPFKYNISPERSSRDDYWTVEVKCDFLMNIRHEFNRPTHFPLHLSIGVEKY
jgi:hypothetical protein